MDYWEQMVTEERRSRAKELGIRLCELEEIERFESTLAASKTEEPVNDLPTQEAPSDAITSNITLPRSRAPSCATSLPDIHSAGAGSEHTLEMPSRVGMAFDLCSKGWQQESYGNADVEEKEGGSDDGKADLAISLAPIVTTTAMSPTASSTIEQGPWIHLPVELLDKILLFLGDPDMCGYLAMTSKSVFRPSERNFRHLCELIYSRQTARGVMGLGKWSSWKSMLIHRPRLRTNGFYSLRTTFTRQHSHDAFWERQSHECIEVKYYRHFRFFDYGRVLYCLDITEPREMAVVLQSGQPIAKRLYEGTYQLHRNHLSVQVMLHYCQMMFDLAVVDGDDGYIGKHNMLTLLSHSSRTKEGFPLATYPIPAIANFRFHRVWSYSAHHSRHTHHASHTCHASQFT